MAELKLYSFLLDSSARSTVKRFDKLGLGSELKSAIDSGMERATKLGILAAQSKVPIDTGTLRNSFISAHEWDGQKSTVYVSDSIHQTAHSPTPKPASKLGEILNAGTSSNRGVKFARNRAIGRIVPGNRDASSILRRSRVSEAETPFTPAESAFTQGWIMEAYNDLYNHLDEILNA